MKNLKQVNQAAIVVNSGPASSLSVTLAGALARGAAELTPDARDKVAAFVCANRGRNGGFRGRGDEEDLYYTAFALDTLHACRPQSKTDVGASAFLLSSATRPRDLIHASCLVRALQHDTTPSARQRRNLALAFIHACRTPDGGFARTPEQKSRAGIYDLFFAVIAYDTADCPLPDTDKIATLPAASAATPEKQATPVLAATLCLLYRLKSGTRAERTALAAELTHRLTDSGGFLANRAAPTPDLLSTATALLALRLARKPLCACRQTQIENLLEQLWHENGGWRGQAADPQSDCEYTFYALLALGCLYTKAPPPSPDAPSPLPKPQETKSV